MNVQLFFPSHLLCIFRSSVNICTNFSRVSAEIKAILLSELMQQKDFSFVKTARTD